MAHDAPHERAARPGVTEELVGGGAVRRSGGVGPRVAIILVALLAVAARAPFITAPLSPDEGGFLLVGSQWHPGSSLYGDYWVDRPPLLITLFGLAAHLGGAVPLRLLGVLAVLTSILLAAALRRTMLPAVVTGVFLSTPLFGGRTVNGELLAVPLVLAGLLCLLRSTGSQGWRQFSWAAGAGIAGTSAMMVKQNVIDVFVVSVVLFSVRRAPGRLATVALAAVSTTAMWLGWADEVRGTSPGSLWDAVVTFRAQAGAVISSSSTAATSDRFVHLLEALAASGAPLVAVALVLALRRGVPGDLRWPALALLAWEGTAVMLGGSYWLHYLIGLVPGLAFLAAAAAVRHRPRRGARLAVAFAVASTACATAAAATATAISPPSADAAVASYLRSSGTRDDGVVVGFGHPNIVWDAGRHSPYTQLWSLPVRVRDPHLARLTKVLSGPAAPRWVVVSGRSLATWGVSSATADKALVRRYREVARFGPYVVWERNQVAGR